MYEQHLLLLAELLKKPPASIEVLPGGPKEWAPQASDEFPFVLVDGHLGIPQKLLYKLYLAAATMNKEADQAAILAFTPIILLANPAHQTALNARKRLVTSGMLHPDGELNLVALYIEGSKECAKQSIIWDHRRWLFSHQYDRIGDAGARPKVVPPGWGTSEEASFFPIIPLGVLEKECEIIRHACELYPRNYHAWAHYQWVLDVARAVVVSRLECTSVDLQSYVCFLRQEVMNLHEWIARHVSDYSAVQLLCNLAVIDRAGAPQLVKNGEGTLVDEIREHALDLVLSYPSHETLWLYLRNALFLSPPDIARDLVDGLRGREDVSLADLEKYIINSRFIGNFN